MDDEEQLRDLFADMCRAWTHGQAEAFGACFTADCVYVSYDGTVTRGRSQVVEQHDKLFRGVLHGSALVGDVESVRLIGDGVALLHATGSVLVAWRTRLPRRRRTRNTIVAVRTSEGWRFAAMHNGRIRPITVPEPDALPSLVARGLARISAALGIGHTSALPQPSRAT